MKTPRAIGLAMALMAALMVPAAAMSQAKKADAPAFSEKERKAGMEKARPSFRPPDCPARFPTPA